MRRKAINEIFIILTMWLLAVSTWVIPPVNMLFMGVFFFLWNDLDPTFRMSPAGFNWMWGWFLVFFTALCALFIAWIVVTEKRDPFDLENDPNFKEEK